MISSQTTFIDEDVDLTQIFPTNTIKSQLRSDLALGSEGARVYAGASDLICASSALFMHDLASAATAVATQEVKKEGSADSSEEELITVTLDHILQCIKTDNRFHLLSDFMHEERNKEKESKRIKALYSKVISDEKYRKRKREGKVQARKVVKVGALGSDIVGDVNENNPIYNQTTAELEDAINSTQLEQVIDDTIIEDDEVYD